MFSCVIGNNGNSFSWSGGLHRGRFRGGPAGNQFRLFTGSGNDLLRLCPGLGKHIVRIATNHDGLRSCDRLLNLFLFIKSRTGQQAGTLNYFRHGIFPADGHDMNAGHALYFFDLVDDINADIDTLLLFILGPFHPLDDLVGHVHAGDEFFHVPGHAEGLGGRDSGKDRALFMEAEVPDHLHEPGKLVNVVNNLGLDKIGAVGDLLAEPYGPELKGMGKGIGGRTK